MVKERSGRLLIVEDEHTLRKLVSEFLRGEGYSVEEAADGGEGVSRFADRGPFDVVLLDLNLPCLPGEEVCRRIKQDRPDQSVVICSAAVLDCHLDVLRGLGVDQFLGKPYHPLDLLDRIASEMSRDRSRRRLDHAAAAFHPSYQAWPAQSGAASSQRP